MGQLAVFCVCVFILWTLTSIGLLFDKNPIGLLSEQIRNLLCLMVVNKWEILSQLSLPWYMISGFYGISMVYIASNSKLETLKLFNSSKAEKLKGN